MNKKKKIKPIIHYINDKEEMINQIFSCVSEEQINKMTPVILKDMSTDELKAECLVQLLTFSNDTIISILEGMKCVLGRKSYAKENNRRESNCYSSEELEIKSETNSSGKRLVPQLEKSVKSSTEQSETENYEGSNSGGTSTTKRKHKDKKHKNGKKKRKSNDGEEITEEDSKGRNLLELLELEMRAKAIRSLLKKEEELEKRQGLNEKSKIENKNDNSQSYGTSSLNLKNKIDKKKGNVIDHTPKNRKHEFKINKIQTKRKKERNLGLRSPKLKTLQCNEEGSVKEEKGYLAGQKMIKTENLKYINKNKNEEDYNWADEDEKLIYEDDEYESDDNKRENERNKDEEKSEDNSRSSWAERWLQSKDVKKVVATSKMLTVVRNKMKNNSKLNTKQKSETIILSPPNPLLVEMEGSVKEYDTLLQMHEAVMESAQKINSSSDKESVLTIK